MHTSQGNLLGRSKGSLQGINHFIEEGEKLEHETPEIKNIYKIPAQNLWKKRK